LSPATPTAPAARCPSAIAALLPQRDQDAFDAIRDAKAYVTRAIAASGKLAVAEVTGPGPYFHALWRMTRGQRNRPVPRRAALGPCSRRRT
jgi:hypothetical protein